MAKKPTYEELEQRVKKLEESEGELVFRNKQLDSLVNNRGFGIVFFDKGMRIVGCDEGFEELFLYAQSEMEGKTVDELIVGGDQIEEAIAYTKTTLTGKSIQGSGQRRRKDGALIDVKFTGIPITVDGEVIGGYGVYEDITALTQAEESLRKSEEKYRNIFNNAQIGIFRTRISDGKVLECNDSFARTHGYETRQECKDDFIASQHYTDPGAREKILASVMEKGDVNDLENSISRRDGKVIWFRFSARAHPEEGYLEGVGYDITEEKKALEALRESEERYRSLMDNLPVAVYRNTPGPEGKFLMANSAFCRMFGFQNEEEVKQVTPASLYQNPEERQEYSDNLIQKGIIIDDERTLLRRDRTPVHTSITSRVVYGKDGQVPYFDSMMLDITDRKRAEDALRESEAQKKAILDASIDRIRLVDRDLRIIWANKTTTRELDIAPEKLVGKICYEFFAERDTPCPGCHMIKALKSGKIEHAVLHQPRSKGITGESYWDTYAVPIKDGLGNIVNLIGISRNITDRKKAEEEKVRLQSQLQRARKMESIGLLAGGVAHDLNNILSGIVGYPDLLLLDLPKDSPIREPIEVIKESGQRAADVVSDLLTVARGIASDRRVSNLNTLVREYLSSPEHKRLASTHPSIAIETVLEPELLNINSSPVHIKKSLMNLVTNASEAIEGIGTVTISTMNRYLDEPLKGYEDVRIGEYAVLSVSDDGIGISSEDLERIFEPFYTKKIMGRIGTGLGLAVVWNTVQDHNGYINVRTSEKGTVFELYFPITREEAAAVKEEVEIEDYLGHGEKILVVDDEQRQREIASGMLTRLGYNAESVSSGEEAIEYVKENPVDLIVLDMVMPKGINGRKTYEEIIKIRSGQKAIITSGFSETEDVKRAQRLGAGKYIKKPYTLEKIGIAVKEELAK